MERPQNQRLCEGAVHSRGPEAPGFSYVSAVLAGSTECRATIARRSSRRFRWSFNSSCPQPGRHTRTRQPM